MNAPRTLAPVGVLLSSFCAVGLWQSVPTAQGPQQTPSPAVTFQVEVNYVDVDAIVTDAQGNFVTELTRDDFELFEDGKLQRVDMFSYVNLPVEKPDRLTFLDRPATSDERTNRRAFEGRVYVIALDDVNVSPLRSALVKKGARDFVERYFGDHDMAAVVYTSGRGDATQEFTNDRRLLLAAIDKFVGRRAQTAAAEALERNLMRRLMSVNSPDAPSEATASDVANTRGAVDARDLERENRAIAVLDTLKNLGEFMSAVRGRRKAVLLISEGIELPMSELYGTGRATTDVLGAIKDAITAATRSNVNFYALDPRGLIGMTTEYIELSGGAPSPENTLGTFGSLNAQQGLLADIRLTQEGLRTLAEETGGFAAVNTNSLSSAFDRIVAGNSRYYLLGYYPPAHPQDGRFHKIEVRVTRPGLRVSARKGYASPHARTARERKRDEDTRKLREARRGGSPTMSAELRDVLNAPMQQGGLAFSVQAAPFRDAPSNASVALAIEFDGARFPFPEKDGVFANRLELTFFGINQDGRAQRATRSEFNLNLRPDTYERVKANGLRVNPRLTLPPGRFQIRVGVRESATGSVGSVFYDMEVPDFRKEPLTISGLLLTAPSAGGAMTALPDPVAATLLPGPATSRRSFLRSDTITLFAELYDNLSPKQPRQIDIGATLLSEHGQVVFSARDVVANGGNNGANWTAFAITRTIPLDKTPPGRYLLRVEALMRGSKDTAPASRETLITVSGP
jgi:VWFA-related protein